MVHTGKDITDLFEQSFKDNTKEKLREIQRDTAGDTCLLKRLSGTQLEIYQLKEMCYSPFLPMVLRAASGKSISLVMTTELLIKMV